MTRAKIVGLCLIVLIVGVCVRVSYVNSQYPGPEDISYSLRQWVAMNDAYLFEKDEPTDGYRFYVNDVRVMTPKEFLSSYATDGVASLAGRENDQRSVIVLDITIRNDSSEPGGLDAFQWYVTQDGTGNAYSYDLDLMSHIGPALGEGQFAVKPHGEYRACFAFTCHDVVPYFKSTESSDAYFKSFKPGTFRISFTYQPVRKQVEFRLD